MYLGNKEGHVSGLQGQEAQGKGQGGAEPPGAEAHYVSFTPAPPFSSSDSRRYGQGLKTVDRFLVLKPPYSVRMLALSSAG